MIRLWGRLSTHEATGAKRGVVSTQMTIVLDGLNLDEIIHTGKPDADRKLCGLYLSVAERMGVPLESFGDATARLAGY